MAVVFAVDLLSSGAVEGWAAKELPTGYSIVAPEMDVPREGVKKGESRYRISVELNP